MNQYLENKPALRVLPKTIEASCYNHVRFALCRLGKPLRIELPDHRGLEIILDNDCWLCVDSSHDDQIIMAWSDFDTRKHNQALHEAVPCQLRLYHMCAGLVMGSALDALDEMLILELAK
jgi:hypothetical protein